MAYIALFQRLMYSTVKRQSAKKKSKGRWKCWKLSVPILQLLLMIIIFYPLLSSTSDPSMSGKQHAFSKMFDSQHNLYIYKMLHHIFLLFELLLFYFSLCSKLFASLTDISILTEDAHQP